jgi:hypothetical protein
MAIHYATNEPGRATACRIRSAFSGKVTSVKSHVTCNQCRAVLKLPKLTFAEQRRLWKEYEEL